MSRPMPVMRKKLFHMDSPIVSISILRGACVHACCYDDDEFMKRVSRRETVTDVFAGYGEESQDDDYVAKVVDEFAISHAL